MASWWDLVLGVLLAPARSGVVATPTHADQEAAAPLVAADPTFRLSRFVRQAWRLIDRMNRAIDDQDLEAVRQLSTPTFARRVCAQLEQDRAGYVRRQRNYQGRPTLALVRATPAARAHDGHDVVVLEVSFRAAEFEVSLLDGRGSLGSPNVRARRERWTLTRPGGAAVTKGSGKDWHDWQEWQVADVAERDEPSSSDATRPPWIWRPDPS